MIEVEVLRAVQKRLSRYIFAKGFISWNGIKRACEKIILALPENEKALFQDKMYPEFEIFIPLLRNGSAEVCKSNERAALLFCMNPNTNLILDNHAEYVRRQEYCSIYRRKEDLDKNKLKYSDDIPFKPVFEPLCFLKSYPSIEKQIESFVEQQIQPISLQFEQNLINYKYEKKNPENVGVGIYKLNDTIWMSSYLYDRNKKIRKIPYYAEDPDSMNLARLYVRINKDSFLRPIFEYRENSQELICNKYSELPILLTRVLLLFEPEQLTMKDFCTNHPSVPFRNVPESAVKELKRIFSDKVIAVI